MTKRKKLTPKTTEKEFDNGYWYAEEIKSFAKQIGIPQSSKLRKDELEKLIKIFLKTGKIKGSERKNIAKLGSKDLEKGLTTSLRIVHYTSNKQTKDFIISEALKMAPGLKIKSGVWYRINRWRDEQITKDRNITYGDLVKQFVDLNQTEHPFQKAPVTRYINFLADYLAHEKGSTRTQAIREWEALKRLDIPKDYKSWKKYNQK